MKYYQNVERPILPPVDLGIMQKTYDTLEQGHLKGVELASKLRSAIAQLPLNESEQAYKDELASGIEQVITENSFAGNAYYAIPDLIKAQGDIDANPVLKNKINAQADYKAFQDSIDANDKMPGDMKEYYKEMNPYKSGQQADGSYDTSFKWTPNASPKMIVSLADMVTKGIARAAKESGGGTVARWLDENGNITTDPNKAYDGEVFNTTTNRWERLTREKILAGIQSVILETPGAQESLKQDYDVALWKLSKQATTDAQGNAILPVSDVTDPNGIPLTETEYLMKRIAPAISAAEYNNIISSSTYGDGLATYKAPRIKQASSALAAFADNPVRDLEAMTSDGRGMVLSIPVNPGGDAINNMNAAKYTIVNAYKELLKKDINPQTYEDLQNAVTELSENLTPYERTQLGSLLRIYKSGEDTLNSYTQNMSDKDKSEFDWANRMLNGGQIINGATKHDDRILKQYFDKFDENGNLNITVSKRTLNRFREYIDNPSDYGIKISGTTITINKNNQNYIPEVFNYIYKSYKDTESLGIMARINIGASDIPRFSDGKSALMETKRVTNEYNKAQKIIDDFSKTYNVNPQNIDVDLMPLQNITWGANYAEQEWNLGIIDLQTYNRRVADSKANIEGYIAQDDLTQYQIWARDNDGKGHIVESAKERFNISEKINAAMHNGRIDYKPAYAPAAIDPLKSELGGYYITIYKDDDKQKIENKYYIPGLGGEQARLEIMNNPEVIASTELVKSAQTGEIQYISVKEENPILGNIKLSTISNFANHEKFNINIWNNDIEMDKADASKFIVALESYKKIKNFHLAGGETNDMMLSALKKIYNDIAETTNYPVSSIQEKLLIDINM